MLDLIWVFMIIIAILFSIITGNVENVQNSLFSGSKTAVELSIKMLGGMMFWLGITEIAEKSGLSLKLFKLLRPVVDFLFPKFKNKEKIKNKICLNITANLLGLGNAATPLGIDAVNEMSKLEKSTVKPSKEIMLFIIMNTASLQILPTQMANLRSSFGSENAFSILIPVWIVSFLTMVLVITLSKICEKF